MYIHEYFHSLDGLGAKEAVSSAATAAVMNSAILAPAFIIAKDDLLTSESGDTAIISVKLATAPLREVTVTFTSRDLTEAKLTHPTLSFNASNWSTAQVVTVVGKNDFENDGNQPFVIDADTKNSSDITYRQLPIDPIAITNMEDVTTVSDARISIGTVRDKPLTIYGDAIVNTAVADVATGLFETTGQKPISDILHGLDGNDTLYGLNLQDDLSGGIGNDTLYGENDDDYLDGGDGNDTLFGGQGIDTLEGGAGNDVLNGGDGDLAADVLIGGAGDDTYYLGYGVVDVITDNGLTADIDTVIMPYQVTSYTLPNGIEIGTITEGTGASSLTGNDSDNTLTGNGGNNTLIGAVGRDSLFGGAGDDQLEGGSGDDQVDAGDGNDEIIASNGTGDDTYIGGAGIDTIKYTSAITGIAINLAQGTASGAEIDNDQLNSIENIIGGQAGDTLTGDGGNNVIDGYTGNDTLIGGLGNDTYLVDNKGDAVTESSKLAAETDTVNSSVSYELGANLENLTLTGTAAINGTGNVLNNVLTGNAGANSLTGGSGVDRLTGGLGADLFKFNAVTDTGITAAKRDSIVDFNHNQGDKIDLSAIDADTTLAGNNAFSTPTVGGAFNGVFANKGGLYFDQAAHVLYGNNDTDSVADFSILLTGVGGLVALDLVL